MGSPRTRLSAKPRDTCQGGWRASGACEMGGRGALGAVGRACGTATAAAGLCQPPIALTPRLGAAGELGQAERPAPAQQRVAKGRGRQAAPRPPRRPRRERWRARTWAPSTTVQRMRITSLATTSTGCRALIVCSCFREKNQTTTTSATGTKSTSQKTANTAPASLAMLSREKKPSPSARAAPERSPERRPQLMPRRDGRGLGPQLQQNKRPRVACGVRAVGVLRG